jgi:glycosyltransferase involved in cell wall biosynthesis
MLLTIALAGAFIFVLSYFAGLKLTGFHRLFLEDITDIPPNFTFPTVNIVFAGRDEEKDIGTAVRTMTALSYPDLKVVAVNDRSGDKTGVILDAIANDNDRLQVVHIRTLPEGWLGKTHALNAALESLPPGDGWVLFTDADIKFAPEALKKAVFYAEANRVDHLVVYPEIETDSAVEKAFLAAFGMLLSMDRPSWRVENPASRKHLGIGAFNLVRRRCLDAIGGFRHISLSVDDDIRLAELLKSSGFRPKIAFGTNQVSLRWQENILAYLRGFEKNAFGSMDYQYWKFAYSLIGAFIVTVLPTFALLLSSSFVAQTLAALIILLQAAILADGKRATNIGPQYALLMPLGGIFIMISMSLSTWVALKNKGITWRGTTYPLSDLRAHVRRRNAHVAEIRQKQRSQP